MPVPSLWGRMVLSCSDTFFSWSGPVPVGTDGSMRIVPATRPIESRPCGDGWFRCARPFEQGHGVPPLRGRMVPNVVSRGVIGYGPAPTGTDGSLPNLFRSLPTQSRPYGDGWFFVVAERFSASCVPSIRRRMVLQICEIS